METYTRRRFCILLASGLFDIAAKGMTAQPPKLTLDAALVLFSGKYSRSFLDASRFVLSWETEFDKGFTDDYAHVRTEVVPNDPGGATRYGIDQRDHPGRDVAGLTLEGALSIYHDGYWYANVLRGGEWDRVRGDDLPPALAMVVFDTAVNPSVKLAGIWLQAAVGIYGKAQDGIIGPKTLDRVRVADQEAVIHSIIAEREAYYQKLADKPKFASFGRGWMNRAEALERCAELRARSSIT